jgi:spore germination protein YaaH
MKAPLITMVLIVFGPLALVACGSSAPAGDGAASDGGPGDAGAVDGASASDAPTSGPDATKAADSGGDALAAADAADAADAGPRLQSLGYYTGTQTSYGAVTSFAAYLTMVSADLYEVQSDGSIVGSDDYDVATYDSAHGIVTYAVLSNYSDSLGDFDPALAHSAMVDHESTVIAGALKIAAGYRGVNVDFESLAYSANIADDRAAYTKFIADLGTALHAQGLELVISVAPKTSDSPGDTWAYPYDYAALAPLVDYLQVMTYDESGPGWSAPGPVSGLDWMGTCVAYATSLMPPYKILIGLPAYAYDWDLTASTSSKSVGASVNWKDVPAILAGPSAVKHWDATSSTPYVDYTSSDGHKHEVWYDDAASITPKAALAGKYGLGGVSMWALGEEDSSFWQAVRAGNP